MATRPVVLVNHLYEPKNRITGVSQYLFSLLNEQVRLGDFSYVLVTNWDRDCLPAELRNSDLVVETCSVSESTPVNIFSQNLILPRLMKKFDAVLEFNPNPLGGFAGQWPKVLTVHDLYFDVNPGAYARRHWLWWKLFFPLNSRAARSIICVSEQTRDDLRRFHPACVAKAVVVHEASTLAPSEPPGPQRGAYGLFVANVSPNKGGDLLVAALDILAQRGRGVEIIHVGRDHGAFDKARSALGTTAGPRLLGAISRDALAELYAHALFLVFPSSYEGFGLPVIEAQTFGVPVIASDIPVLREVAGDGALYFPRGDAAAMATRITSLQDDAHLWRRLHERALINAARFSWRQSALETSAVFRGALNRAAQ